MSNLPAVSIYERLRSRQPSGIALQISKGGFSRPAHISIQDNRFTLVNAQGERSPWPHLALDVVIVAVGPSLRVFYDPAVPYDANAETEDKIPLCSSQDDTVPDEGVRSPQSTACSMCPRNAFGSDPRGSKGKACQEYKRLAVTVVNDSNPASAYLFGVPSGSFRNLRDYGAQLRRLPLVEGRPIDTEQVVTRVEFASQGVLKFTPVGWSAPYEEQIMRIAQAGLFDAVLSVHGREDAPQPELPPQQQWPIETSKTFDKVAPPLAAEPKQRRSRSRSEQAAPGLSRPAPTFAGVTLPLMGAAPTPTAPAPTAPAPTSTASAPTSTASAPTPTPTASAPTPTPTAPAKIEFGFAKPEPFTVELNAALSGLFDLP